jgi:two-component system OmpR family sensor kinase
MVGLAAIGVIAVVVAALVTVTAYRTLVLQLDNRLQSLAVPMPLSEQGGRDGDHDDLDNQPNADQVQQRPSDVFRGFLAEDGTLTVTDRPTVDEDDEIPIIDAMELATDQPTLLTVGADEDDDRFRVFARPLATGGWDITALSTQNVEEATARLVTIELLGIGAVLLGLGAVGWWVIRLGVAPMREMVEASKQIAAGDLSVRLQETTPGTESAELAQSLNSMIGTLTDSLADRERSEVRLREFVADASHELRTPLTTVLGYAELHGKGALAEREAQDDAWRRTQAEGNRMRRLVEDMLELATLDAEPALQKEPVDVARLAHDVVADAARAHSALTFELDTPPGPAVVPADADRVCQAMINLVGNAAQHGGASVVVTVDSLADGAVSVAVADDGPGMSVEVAERATERFVRGDASRSRATGGAGLGLAITAAIIEAHGGELIIDSVPGQGTTVSFTLPPSAPLSP